MSERLRWLTITVPAGPGDAVEAGAAALTTALGDAGLVPSDVLHLKVWAPRSVTVGQLAATWTPLFADREHRPSLSLIPSPVADGVAMVVTVAAAPGAVVTGHYEPHQAPESFSSASVAGDHLFVAALQSTRTGTDASAQAAEVFERIGALVAAAGGSDQNLGHLFVWYADHSVRDVINEPFLEMFSTPGDRPARHSVVRELDDGAALMIEAAGSLGAPRSCFTVGGLWHGGIGGVPNSLPFGTACGDLLFSAGTYGRNPSDGQIPDGFADQAPWAVHYSQEFLRVAGMTAADVEHVYVWIRDPADAEDARKVVEAAFHVEGSTLSVQVIPAALPGTNQIQLELVAQRGHPSGAR